VSGQISKSAIRSQGFLWNLAPARNGDVVVIDTIALIDQRYHFQPMQQFSYTKNVIADALQQHSKRASGRAFSGVILKKNRSWVKCLKSSFAAADNIFFMPFHVDFDNIQLLKAEIGEKVICRPNWHSCCSSTLFSHQPTRSAI